MYATPEQENRLAALGEQYLASSQAAAALLQQLQSSGVEVPGVRAIDMYNLAGSRHASTNTALAPSLLASRYDEPTCSCTIPCHACLLSRLEAALKQCERLHKDKDDLLKRRLQLLRSMLGHWQCIKKLRVRQGFLSTSISFKVQKLEADEDEDTRAQEQEVQLLLLQKYTAHALKLSDEASDLDSQGRLRGFEWEQHATRLRQDIAADRKPAGQPTLIPHVLHDLTVTTSRSCPGRERSRRNKVQQLRYDIELYVSEKQVSSIP